MQGRAAEPTGGFVVGSSDLFDYWDDDRGLNKELLKHLERCADATRGARNLPFAVDKANVDGLSIQNAVLVTGAGEGLVLCPRVDIFGTFSPGGFASVPQSKSEWWWSFFPPHFCETFAKD